MLGHRGWLWLCNRLCVALRTILALAVGPQGFQLLAELVV
jgi:hypothetical protein